MGGPHYLVVIPMVNGSEVHCSDSESHCSGSEGHNACHRSHYYFFTENCLFKWTIFRYTIATT